MPDFLLFDFLIFLIFFLSTEDEESVSLSETLLVNSESLSDKTYFFYLPFLRDLRFEILNDTELHELLESLAGNDFRIFLFFFSFLTLIDSTDKLESEELSLLDCELKSEDTLNCVFLDLYFEIGIFLPFSK
jgi:hypothetical protein